MTPLNLLTYQNYPYTDGGYSVQDQFGKLETRVLPCWSASPEMSPTRMRRQDSGTREETQLAWWKTSLASPDSSRKRTGSRNRPTSSHFHEIRWTPAIVSRVHGRRVTYTCKLWLEFSNELL